LTIVLIVQQGTTAAGGVISLGKDLPEIMLIVLIVQQGSTADGGVISLGKDLPEITLVVLALVYKSCSQNKYKIIPKTLTKTVRVIETGGTLLAR
jgi:hypothetical protein